MNERSLADILAEIETMSKVISNDLEEMQRVYGIKGHVDTCYGLRGFGTDGTMRLYCGIEKIEEALGIEAEEIKRYYTCKKVIEREDISFGYQQIADEVPVKTSYAKAEVVS